MVERDLNKESCWFILCDGSWSRGASQLYWYIRQLCANSGIMNVLLHRPWWCGHFSRDDVKWLAYNLKHAGIAVGAHIMTPDLNDPQVAEDYRYARFEWPYFDGAELVPGPARFVEDKLLSKLPARPTRIQGSLPPASLPCVTLTSCLGYGDDCTISKDVRKQAKYRMVHKPDTPYEMGWFAVGRVPGTNIRRWVNPLEWEHIAVGTAILNVPATLQVYPGDRWPCTQDVLHMFKRVGAGDLGYLLKGEWDPGCWGQVMLPDQLQWIDGYECPYPGAGELVEAYVGELPGREPTRSLCTLWAVDKPCRIRLHERIAGKIKKIVDVRNRDQTKYRLRDNGNEAIVPVARLYWYVDTDRRSVMSGLRWSLVEVLGAKKG